MKPNEWNEGLNHLDQDLVEEYIMKKESKRAPKRPFWTATVAAALALTVGLGMLMREGILPDNAPNLETLPATQAPTTAATAAPTKPPVPVVPTKPVVTVPPTAAPTSPVVTVPPTTAPTSPVVTVPPTTAPTGPVITVLPTAAPTSPVITVPPTVAPTKPPVPAVPTRPVVTNPPTTPPQEPVIVPLNNRVSAPVYPKMMQYPSEKDYTGNSMGFYRAVGEWEASRKKQYLQPAGYADSLTDFFHESIQQFLQGEGNQVYSPLNVYMAMAMLAETADGDSRQQILDLFGLDTIEQLREQVGLLWNAHYCQDGITDTLLANSIWLDHSYNFKRETAQLLAERYYASSFSGDLGTEAMNKQLQSWLNENTGGLLTEQANSMELPEQTAFSLASALYFTASWESEFWEEDTKEALFHSADADRLVPFMNAPMRDMYYWSENFGAIRLGLTGDNAMWLILPDEGYTVADILASEEYLQMTLNPGAWPNKKEYKINLSLPKFDVVEQQDLVSGMKAMGIADVFDPVKSNFSALTDEKPLWVDGINHAARVVIDEEGCKGAAFTVIFVAGAAPLPEVDEIDFTLDRPFLFTVSSQDNLPLFAGIVNEP